MRIGGNARGGAMVGVGAVIEVGVVADGAAVDGGGVSELAASARLLPAATVAGCAATDLAAAVFATEVFASVFAVVAFAVVAFAFAGFTAEAVRGAEPLLVACDVAVACFAAGLLAAALVAGRFAPAFEDVPATGTLVFPARCVAAGFFAGAPADADLPCAACAFASGGFHTSLYSATAAADPLITPTTTSNTVRKNATFVPLHTTKTAILARHGGAPNAFARSEYSAPVASPSSSPLA
ncbi:hypothetical protein [Paraburkholderia jirisanensis]